MDIASVEELGAVINSGGDQQGADEFKVDQGTDTVGSSSDLTSRKAGDKSKVESSSDDMRSDPDGHNKGKDEVLYGDRERPGVKDLLGSIGDILGKGGLTSGPQGIPYPDDLAWLKNVDVQSLMLMVNGETNHNMTTLIQGMNVRIQGQANDMKSLHDKNIENIVAATEAAAKVHSPFGIFMKVITAVVMFVLAALSILACVVAPSPLTIVAAIAAVLAMVNSFLAVASVATGTSCTLSSLFLMLGQLIASALESSGMDEKKAKDIGDTVAGLFGTISLSFLGDPAILAQFFSGVGRSCGMSDDSAYIFAAVMAAIAMVVMMVVCFRAGGLNSLKSIVDKLGGFEQLSRVAGAIDSAVSSAVCASQLAQSSYGIYSSKMQCNAMTAESDVSRIRAFIQQLRGLQDNDTKDLKEYAKALTEITKCANETVKSMCRAKDVAFQHMA